MFKKWKTIPLSVRSAAVFGICAVFTQGTSFLLTPLYTRLMSREQYGIVTEYTSWHAILEVFALFGMGSVGGFNTGLNEYKDRRDRYMSSILFMTIITNTVTFLMILFIKRYLAHDLILSEEFLVLMFAGFLFAPAINFYTARCRYEYNYRTAGVISVLNVILSQGLSVILLLSGPRNETGLSFLKVLGSVVGTTLCAIPVYIHIIKRGGIKPDPEIIKKMLCIAAPLIPHYLSLYIMNGSDRIILAKVLGEETAASYGVSANIGIAVTVFWVAVNGSLMPYIFESMNRDKTNEIGKNVADILFGYALLIVPVVVISPELLMIMAPDEYKDGLTAIAPMASAMIFNALYNIYASIEFYYKKTFRIAVNSVVSCLINVILNLFLVRKFGIAGVAYATLAANILLTFLHYRGCKKCERENGHCLFKNGLMWAACFSLTGAGIGLSLMYDTFALRYSVLLAGLVTVLIFRKRIFGILKTLKTG